MGFLYKQNEEVMKGMEAATSGGKFMNEIKGQSNLPMIEKLVVV